MKPSKGCIDRLNKEYRRLVKEPVPHVIAKPDPSNILEWHFVIDGQEGTPYHGGTYHGKLLFPADYPFKPPGILFITPSGRFKPYTKICFSFSDYHPECWNPIWHVGTILIATVSFMNEESSTTGSVKSTDAERRRLAKLSLENSCKTSSFVRIFPEYQERMMEQRRQENTVDVVDRDGGSHADGAAGAEDLQAGAEQERGVLDVPAIMQWAMPVAVAAIAAGVVCMQIAFSKDG